MPYIPGRPHKSFESQLLLYPDLLSKNHCVALGKCTKYSIFLATNKVSINWCYIIIKIWRFLHNVAHVVYLTMEYVMCIKHFSTGIYYIYIEKI